LTAIAPLRSVSSHFVLKQIKSTTALPLDLSSDSPEPGANFTAGLRPARGVVVREAAMSG